MQIRLIGLNGMTTRLSPRALAASSEMVSNTLRGRWVSGSCCGSERRSSSTVPGSHSPWRCKRLIRAVWPTSGFASTKASSTSMARHDKAIGRDIAAIVEEHVVQQGTVIRLADSRAGLHRFRGQSDLWPFSVSAFGYFQADPFALYRVGVFDGDLRVIQQIARICSRCFSA